MVFISHKWDPDHPFAVKVRDILERNGIPCWIAPESVSGGRDYASEIPWAINTCEVFLLILSQASIESAHIRKEVDFAIRYKKRILPLKLGSFDINSRYEYLLTDIQILPVDVRDDSLRKVVDFCLLSEPEVHMAVSQNPPRSVTVATGDFQANMAKYVRESPDELSRTMFAIGMDRSSRLDISSTKGILRWVLSFIREELHVPVDYVQELVNAAKMEQLGHGTPGEPLRFKDIVVIRVPLSLPDTPGAPHFQLMLVANSQKSGSYSETHDLDDIEGIDSREIVIAVFNKCRELGERASTLFIGAMGTNGLSFPYEVVTSEILNCYLFAQRMNYTPYNLCYSVRKSDMENAGLTLDEIMEYITTVMHFFRK